jgi:hypothetical protein
VSRPFDPTNRTRAVSFSVLHTDSLRKQRPAVDDSSTNCHLDDATAIDLWGRLAKARYRLIFFRIALSAGADEFIA